MQEPKLQRIIRDRRLTPEEIASDQRSSPQSAEEFPPCTACGGTCLAVDCRIIETSDPGKRPVGVSDRQRIGDRENRRSLAFFPASGISAWQPPQAGEH